MSCLSCSCLTAPAGTPGPGGLAVLKVGILVLFSIWGGSCPCFTGECDVSCAFYQVGEVPFCFYFIQCFYGERVLDFAKCFPALTEVVMWFCLTAFKQTFIVWFLLYFGSSRHPPFRTDRGATIVTFRASMMTVGRFSAFLIASLPFSFFWLRCVFIYSFVF